MNRFGKSALLGLGLAGVMLAGGCASGYRDSDGYYHRDRSYYRDRDRDRDGWRDRDRDSKRVRVCDADGDDCHWEYRRR